jgi:hypothetical protein
VLEDELKTTDEIEKENIIIKNDMIESIKQKINNIIIIRARSYNSLL